MLILVGLLRCSYNATAATWCGGCRPYDRCRGVGCREDQQLQESLAEIWLRFETSEEELMRRVREAVASSAERSKRDSDQLR